MRCICIKNCFIDAPIKGKCIHYAQGDIRDFEECPPNVFMPLEDLEINFATVSREVMESSGNWERKYAELWLKKTFGVDVPSNMPDERFIPWFINTREQYADLPSESKTMRASDEKAAQVKVDPAAGDETATIEIED